MEASLALPIGLLLLIAVAGYALYRHRAHAESNRQEAQYSLLGGSESAAQRTPWVALSLRVPPQTKWESERAQRLMVSLFGLRIPITFALNASVGLIEWRIQVSEAHEDTVKRSLYALYPQAQISSNKSVAPHLGYRLYQFQGATPFIGPLQYATDFRKTLSPIAPVVSAMGDLVGDEKLIYELCLRPAQQDYDKLGEELLTTSVVQWFDYLTPADTLSATALRVSGADKTDKYLPDIRKTARGKLADPLMEASLAIKCIAHSRERALQLTSGFKSALATYGRPGYSYLLPASEETYPLVLSPGEAGALWHLPTQDCMTQGIRWATTATAPLPSQLLTTAPSKERASVVLGTSTFQNRAQQVALNYVDRVTHVNLIGRTRVGKSTLMHHMVHQDLEAGQGVGVVDPHGDMVRDILACSIPAHREDNVVLFDVTDMDYPIGLNLLAVPPGVPSEVGAAYALAVIRKMFADNWHSGRMENVLYACLASLVTYPGATIMDIPRILVDGAYRDQVLQRVNNLSALEYWYDVHESLRPAAQLEIAQPIINRIQRFYRDPVMRRIICQRESLDFRRILNGGHIFLANLGGLSDIEGETLGAMLVSKIQMAAMSRSSMSTDARRPFYCYIDEVQNFATTSLPTMFSEAGKYGLSLVVANQYLRQLQGSTLEAILGNVGTTVIFRCGPDDARILGGFVRPQFDGTDLVNLDRFQTVVNMQHNGQTLPAFSMGTMPPLPRHELAADKYARIRERSRALYAIPKEQADDELASRYHKRSDSAAPETPEEKKEQRPGDEFLG